MESAGYVTSPRRFRTALWSYPHSRSRRKTRQPLRRCFTPSTGITTRQPPCLWPRNTTPVILSRTRPPITPSTSELDAVYNLNYERDLHPYYGRHGKVKGVGNHPLLPVNTPWLLWRVQLLRYCGPSGTGGHITKQEVDHFRGPPVGEAPPLQGNYSRCGGTNGEYVRYRL